MANNKQTTNKAAKNTERKEKQILFHDLPRDKQIEIEAEAEVMGISPAKLWANRLNAQTAGRPKGSESESTLLKRKMHGMMVRKVYDMFPELMRTKFDLAMGHNVYAVIVDPKTGKPKIDPVTGKPLVELVQVASPDPKSSEYLLDHVLGKPTLKMSHEEPENLDEELTAEEQAHVDELFSVMAEEENYDEEETER